MSRTNRIDLLDQSDQGNKATSTLRYDGNQQIAHPDDLIDLKTVTPMQELLNELAPPAPDGLSGKPLSIYQNTTVLVTGYLSTDPAATYKAGHGAGSQVPYITKDPDFTLVTPTPTTGINKGDKGTLNAYVNGVLHDTFDLEGIFDEGLRDASQSYSMAGGGAASLFTGAGGKVRILSVDKYNNFKAHQKLVALIDLAAADLVIGHNFISLVHTDLSSGDQTSTDFDLFWDNATATPTIDPILVEIADNTHPKYLSGVRYLGANDVVNVTTAGNALFDNAYVLNPITFSGNGFPTVIVAPTDTAVSGVQTPPAKLDKAIITSKAVTLSVANQCDADARITGTPRDPHGAYAGVTSPSVNLLLSTFGNRSGPLVEHFDDEEYRLPLSWDSDDKVSGITGHWDSTALLGSDDSQYGIIADNEHGLIYPSVDYTSHQPANTANYAGFTGDTKQLRALQGSSAKSSIQVLLDGVAGGISPVGSGDLNVEIKLPTVGGWWDAAKPFGGALGGGDGEGCMVGSISYSGGKATINITFGTNSSFGSNFRAYLRITTRNGSRSVKSIACNW